MRPLQLQPGPAGREHTRASELSIQMCMCSAYGVRVLVPRGTGVLMSALMNQFALNQFGPVLLPYSPTARWLAALSRTSTRAAAMQGRTRDTSRQV